MNVVMTATAVNRKNKGGIKMTLLNNWSVIFGLIILAITLFVQLLITRKIKIENAQTEDIKEKCATKIEENRTSKSPAETLTEEFEEAYKRTRDPGLGIILQFRQMDAEIEKIREEKDKPT